MNQAPILVLDEPSSLLDSISEYEIQSDNYPKKRSENVKLSNYKALSFLNYQQLKEMIDDFSSLHYAIRIRTG